VKFVLISLPLPVEEHCLKYREIVVSDQIPFLFSFISDWKRMASSFDGAQNSLLLSHSK
jgi:hypothetical protein